MKDGCGREDPAQAEASPCGKARDNPWIHGLLGQGGSRAGGHLQACASGLLLTMKRNPRVGGWGRGEQRSVLATVRVQGVED